MIDYKTKWRQRAREYLCIAFGGKCTICGYNKVLSAMDYHHIDAKEKDKLLSIGMRNGWSWDNIVKEARKCTLVCCRCHREIHAGVTCLPDNCAKFNEEYADIIRLKQTEYDTCPICSKEKRKSLVTCSRQCVAMKQNKITVSKEELEELIEELPFTEVGKIFGVSDQAIKKRCKKLGIECSRGRGYWTKITTEKYKEFLKLRV